MKKMMIILLASGICKPLFGSSNDCFGSNNNDLRNQVIQMSEEEAVEKAVQEARIIAAWEEETEKCIAAETTPSTSNVTTPELARKIRPTSKLSPKTKIVTNDTKFNAAFLASKARVLNFK